MFDIQGFDFNSMNPNSFGELGAMLGVFTAFLAVFIVVFIILYIYSSFAWMTILKKIKYHTPWMAWIPFANLVPFLEKGGFHWAWVFLLLLPVLGWIAVGVMAIIGVWKIFEQRRYPGWLSLAPLLSLLPVVGSLAGIAQLVILGLVAWKDQ